jgi:hypothetical protein
MKKVYEWIKKNKLLTIFILLIVIILPLALVQVIFKFPAPCKGLEAVWDAGDVIGYCGDVLSFLGTIVLGYIAIVQSDNANKLSKDLLELEWKRQQPCFDIISNQTYKMYLGDEIEKYKSMVSVYDELFIEPSFIMNPRTGINTSIALIELLVTNTGNSDIRNIYIKDMKFYLGLKSPRETQMPFGFFGNQYIKQGDTRKLIIEFQQELVESDDNLDEQIEWIINDYHIMPRLEFVLHIISVEGFKYEEEISIGSGWHKPLKDKGLILERIPNVSRINIKRIDMKQNK